MKRAEFVFTIGFQGDAAVVDRRAMRSYRNLGTMELAELGMYRAAFCSALFSGDASEMQQFISYFSEKTDKDDLTEDQVKRLFGVHTVPDDVKKVIAV